MRTPREAIELDLKWVELKLNNAKVEVAELEKQKADLLRRMIQLDYEASQRPSIGEGKCS